eukprot:11097740-Alexandrium_andersonii.AAC.1
MLGQWLMGCNVLWAILDCAVKVGKPACMGEVVRTAPLSVLWLSIVDNCCPMLPGTAVPSHLGGFTASLMLGCCGYAANRLGS